MKKRYTNIKRRLNSKKEGNISILVIFVLLASGVIGILTMHFVRQIIQYNGSILSYYKSYYLARGGLELSLAQVTHRGIGFEYEVGTGDTILTENFDCKNCGFVTTIHAKDKYINAKPWLGTGCNDNTKIVVNPGESSIIPLHYDVYTETNNVSKSLREEENLDFTFKHDLRFTYDHQWERKSDITLSLITDGEDMITQTYTDGDYDQNFTDFLHYIIATDSNRRKNTGNYLLISNIRSDAAPLEFCLEAGRASQNVLLDSDQALQFSHIKSIGTYQNKTIGLEAVFKHTSLPSFLGQTSLGGGF